MPRFTVLTQEDRNELESFFSLFADQAFRILAPGGHLFIASSPLLSHLVYLPLMRAGFEKRGEVIRLVQTLRAATDPRMRMRNSRMSALWRAHAGSRGACFVNLVESRIICANGEPEV